MNLEKAVAIATEAHKDHKDKYGQPYLGHVFRVMNAGKTDNERIAGVLHDLVEDTLWTFEDLAEAGFAHNIIEAIRCLSKTSENEDYESFTARVATSPLAIKVKLNDLMDNLDIRRMPEITEKDIKRLNKYLKAYKMLVEL
ncbi:MAG: HD domain-containing protein [Chitinophagaceae bacterium]